MSQASSNPMVQVGDGANAVTVEKQGAKVALHVDSEALAQALADIVEELRTIRELIASQL
jgi:hypothetical protein